MDCCLSPCTCWALKQADLAVLQRVHNIDHELLLDVIGRVGKGVPERLVIVSHAAARV